MALRERVGGIILPQIERGGSTRSENGANGQKTRLDLQETPLGHHFLTEYNEQGSMVCNGANRANQIILLDHGKEGITILQGNDRVKLKPEETTSIALGNYTIEVEATNTSEVTFNGNPARKPNKSLP